MRTRLSPVTLLLPALLLFLPGCVVWEIRDEMRATNQHLDDVKESLETANTAMATANEGLAQANSRLDQVDEGLARLDQTNTLMNDVGQDLGRVKVQLEGVGGQLAVLDSIQTSLQRLDVHLASLRKTIGSIDSMIPFLDLGGGGQETPLEPDLTEMKPSVQAEGGDRPDAGEAAAGQKRDVILGVWVRRYPEPDVALVLLNDGKYIRSTTVVGDPPLSEGRWTREGAVITFTPDPGAAASGTPPAGQPAGTNAASTTGKTPDAVPATPAGPRKMTIVSATTRTLALRSDLGELLVFGRP